MAAQTIELIDLLRIQTMRAWADKKSRASWNRVKPMVVSRPESVSPKKKRSWVEFARGLARKVGR